MRFTEILENVINNSALEFDGTHSKFEHVLSGLTGLMLKIDRVEEVQSKEIETEIN